MLRSMLKPLGIGVAALTLLALEGGAMADDHGAKGHAHKAPHGGVVQSAGKYHFELVAKDDGIDVYLLDEKEATLPVDGKEGKLVLQIPKKAKQDLPLSPSGETLRAAVDLTGVNGFVALVSIQLEGKKQSARFSWKRAAAGEPPHDHAGHDHGAKDGGKAKKDGAKKPEGGHQH